MRGVYFTFGDLVEDEKARQRAIALEVRIRNMKRESMRRHFEKWDAIWNKLYGSNPQEETIDVECIVVEPKRIGPSH